PFKEECIKGLEKAVENIDIGGVAMVRAAAKAALLYGETIVLTNPDQYDEVVSEIENYGWIEKKKIIKLAVEAFKKTCEYENEISKYLLEALK
ncbi:MAG: bifunctional phosphoribosylaminoimidazolecarboxamide formyltransferase/IMP cyclohydrolase, partial [Candidatus Methanomethylicia archaeon]